MSLYIPKKVLHEHTEDPAQKILKEIGDISDFELLKSLVLVVTYIQPEKTAGGIIKPDSMQNEDKFQGKIGLVVKVGPLAFENNPDLQFGSRTPKVGDWVVYAAPDGKKMAVNGVHCRTIEDQYIDAIIKNPDMVY